MGTGGSPGPGVDLKLVDLTGTLTGGDSPNRLQVTYSDDPLARFRLNCRETDDVGSRRATSPGHGN